MSWISSLGSMAKTAIDFTGLPGLFKDLATAGSNDDPWYVDGINLAKNTVKVTTTPVRLAVGGLLAAGEASYELGGKVRREGVETILDQPFMYNKFKNENESYADYTARVEREKENISLGQATLSILSPGKNAGEKSGWFQDWTDNNLKFLSAGFDLFDPMDRETAFQDQYRGKFLSGIQDITASTIIDPLTFTGFIGKGAVIMAKAPMLDTISGKTARAVFGKFAMTEERLDNILMQALDGKGEALTDINFLTNSGAKEQYEYWRKKKVTNPDAMAYLFGRANSKEEVVDTFRAVMYKDSAAISKIADADSEAGLVFDALNDVPHPHRMLLEGKSDGDLITSPKYNEVLQGYIAKAATEDDRFRVALETVQTGGQFKYGFSRGPWEGKLAEKSKAKAARVFAEPESVLIQKTSLHPIIKVVNYFRDEMPSGVFNVNDGDSYTEFNAFLREVNDLAKGGFGTRAAQYADEYLGAASAGERNGIIQRAEKEAFSVLFPTYTPSQIDSLYAIFDSRRVSRIKAHRDQGFVSYLENGQVINAVSPVLQRESANYSIIADMRKLSRAIKAHEGVLPGLLDGIDLQDLALRTDKGLAALGTINDIFKTSVLMRLGYTVRNITEAQLSMLAKGFAMPAMVAAGGTQAVERFFKNRKVGFNRLIDQVNIRAGRLEDVDAMQYAFMSDVDKIRAVDMSRKQLAKEISKRIGELERDAFKVRFTEDVGPLTVEDEVRTLKGALADLESMTLYHGSPDAKFKLDETRSVAMSASPAVARRYAEGGTIHNVEDYIPTPSGRPGRLGQKPELTPGAEIGTRGVIEQMPLAEFEEVKQYVRGGYAETQLDLRDPNRWGTTNKEKIPAMLQRAIQRSVIKENTVVYRGTSNPDILNAKLGDIIVEKGFTSTSKKYRVAEKFAFVSKQDSTVVKIELPKGTNGLDIVASYKGFSKLDSELSKTQGIELKLTDADMFGESEVLLPANTKFEVVNVVEGQAATKDFPAIKPVVTLRAIVEEPKLPSPKRASTLDEAMIALQTDMIDAVNAGRKVEVKDRADRWREVKSIDYRTLVLATESDDLETVLFKDWTRRPIFRVNYSEGSVKPIRVYGPSLRMDRWSELPLEVRALFNNKASEYRTWLKSKGWQDQKSPIYQYLRDNGYSSAAVLDDKRASGLSYIVLPDAIDKKGRTREVDSKIKTLMAKQGEAFDWEVATDFQPQMATAKERREALRAARKAKRRPDAPVSPYYNKDNINAMINNGVVDAAENLSRIYTMSHAHLDDMSERLGAAITRAESNAIKQRTGYGYMEVEANGIKYEVPEVFQDASWFMGRTSAEDTWNAQVGTQEMAFSAGIGARTVSPMKPNDPRYFEGWANILNMHFRDPETGIMDPVVRKILDGETDEDILRWFTRNFEGRKYANDTYTTPRQAFGFTALKGGELDDDLLEKINITRGAVKVYIPDEETALILSRVKEDGKVVSGGEIQNWLRDRFKDNPENLPEINGLLVTTSKEYRDQERLIDTFNRRVMRFLGSLPEDVFARHPLARATYNKRIQVNLENLSAAKGSDKLTAEEIERAIRGAREDSRREVERTLFTIVRRSRASSSQVMQLMFPFFAAYENTMKRWSGIVAENPQAVATAGRVIAQLVNGQTVIDQDGNRITDAKKLTEEGMANLVVQVPEGFIKSLPKQWQEVAENAFKSVSIPLSSLDVITQGQPGNPGFGPYAVLPTYLIVRNRPELEDAFKPLFPAGQPQKVSDLFTPAAIRRLTTMWTQDELYVRTFNQMLRYEAYNFNNGKRVDSPTMKEIEEKTNKFFLLRALGSISLPIAISPEMDFYQATFRQFMTQYGPGEAESKFLEMYPDYFEATVSLSKSPGGLEANLDTVRNLRKHRGLMGIAEASDNPELIGFLANDFDGQYTFSNAAYQWQYRQGAYPGSKNTYRQNRSPEELLRDANVKRGWTQFNSLMGQINTYKIQNGIVSDKDPAMDVINNAKRFWVRQQAEQNLDWYSDYISPDRAKYERRAIVLEKALADKAWMAQNGNRPVVKAMAVYLDARKQLGSLLKQRGDSGGSRALDAKSNADIVYVLDQVRTQLVAESPEFEEFLNRYFINDTVVV